jgi:signal transduction histidine kinase
MLSAHPAAPSAEELPAPLPVNILLVDDQPRNLLALEAILGDLGQNLVTASSGEAALDCLLADDFAVVLLDVQMPGLDGFETARLIRARDRSRLTPIIFLTAFERPDSAVVEAYRLGAVDYLVKPLVPEILRAKVTGFVELHQKTERLRLLERRDYERRLAEEKQRWEMERLQEAAARDRQRAVELAEADQRKDEFLAMLGHELRNPLAPIRNVLHVLQLRGDDPSTLNWIRGILVRQVGHLTRMVDDLLEVSRITRGKVKLEQARVDLAELVRDTVQDHRPALENARLTVTLAEPSGPVWVEGDAVRLAQVVGNLLHNAGKFTEPAGRVLVSLTLEPDAQRAVVAVRDTGIGIEPEMLPHIFETFAQGEAGLARTRGGLGLGLALVKSLVERHGGEVRATSAGRGQGTEVTFWLPVAPAGASLPASTPPPAETGEKKRKVLIIEDNEDAAESLRLLLELRGHQVRLAHSGTDGVKVARRWLPEVVLCDLGLPGMDGFAVARALREDPRTAQVRLIAVSGYGHDEDQQRGREAGFDLHVLKPIDPADLEKLLAGRTA